MTTAMAHRHHLMKLDLVDDLRGGQANKSVNPSLKSIEYMRSTWIRQNHGGLSTLSMFNAIQKYAADNPELRIKVDHNDERFCVVLVTPFMKRAHEHLREASEVVFVDSTGCVGQLNTAVIPFICAGPSGAVPLAVLFTSCQDQVTLTRGFGMIKEVLGDCAFYGRGAPQSFMTKNCEAVRKSLAATWPTANLFLCIFKLLRQVWHWLLDSKHRIQKDNIQDLMAAMKSLVYARSISEFNTVWQSLQSSSLMDKYPFFKSYVAALVERKEDWAIAFRASKLLPGHHANIFCKSIMCIIKDVALSRCKAYNTSQLLMFMVEIFDVYMRQRLIDVALGRRHVKPIITTKIALDNIALVDDSKYEVQSESDPAIKYNVDLEIGLCSCLQGQTGAICKHQIACAEFSITVVPQQFLINSESHHRLAVLAVGQEKAPDVMFRKLNEDGSCEISGREKINEIVSVMTEDVDVDMNEEPICKHQIACAEFSITVVPQQFLINSESHHRLAVLAVGQEKAPDVMLFRKLNEDGSCEISGREKINEIVSVMTEDVDVDMNEEPMDQISKTNTMSSSDDDFASSVKTDVDVKEELIDQISRTDTMSSSDDDFASSVKTENVDVKEEPIDQISRTDTMLSSDDDFASSVKTENVDVKEEPIDQISRTDTMSSSDDDDFASSVTTEDVDVKEETIDEISRTDTMSSSDNDFASSVKTEDVDVQEKPMEQISMTDTMLSSDNFPSRKISHDVADAIVRVSACYGNSNTELALKKFLECLNSIKTPNQLNKMLHCTASATRNGGARRGKIPCQPNSIARRLTGRRRGAAPLCKCCHPTGAVSSQPK